MEIQAQALTATIQQQTVAGLAGLKALEQQLRTIAQVMQLHHIY